MAILCLKDTPVLEIKEVDGKITEISSIITPEALPLSLKGNCTTESFFRWLNKRGIPEKREGLANVADNFGLSWKKNKNYASLTDHYWIKRADENYRKVNFFSNKYSGIVGDMFFYPWKVKAVKPEISSPDLTTNGILKKRWIQNKDNTSMLIKAGSVATHQEPLSEVLVSVMCENLGIVKSAGYDLYVEGLEMCSICKNFIDFNLELVAVKDIYNTIKKDEKDTAYKHIIKVCEYYKIPGAKEYLDGLIFIDNLTGNEDRNLSNIAFLRNPDTLEFVGPAPVYDCGNAYWSTKKINEKIKSKMFHDVEQKIYRRLKKSCNLDYIAKDKKFEKIVRNYPEIGDEKKDNLIKEIKKRNLRFAMREREHEMVL